MKHHKIIILLENKPNQLSKLRLKIGLKQVMTCKECTALLVKLNLKGRFQSQVYVIIVTRTYLLKEL